MTKPSLTPEQAAALGLSPEELGRSERVPTAADDAARGFARVGELRDALDAFAETELPLAALLGFEVATTRDRHQIQVVNVDGGPLMLRTWGDVERVEVDEGCVALRLGVGALALAERPVGARLLLRGLADGIELQESVAKPTPTVPLQVEPLEDIPPCPALSTLALEAWSADQIAAWYGEGSNWFRAAAVGAAIRLALPLDPAAEVAARLAGKVPPRVGLVTAWAEELGDGVVRSLEERAVATVEGLAEGLASVEVFDPLEDADARAALLLQMCEARETLACVEEVLRRSGRAHRTPIVAAGLDRAATIAIAALVRPRLQTWSPLLGRAAVVEPDAWWVAPLADLSATTR